ncbi:hypothetical protein HHL17_20655 [Chitinophaga sp. G-6-1-13]|uniref:Uncharacterized protein n=1 Tax=Chitinophaga fulva TaxID=2728842 RepID=A0A848GSB8_9BACT|nr:hypothetical protein [Chitinophaga fulva]NML39623.1 hypothetical protein [Chitinophaga fulva]
MQKDIKYKLSKKLKKELKIFLEDHPAKRVNRNLREVFMTFVAHCLHVSPLNMKDIIWDMTCLMELFDLAEDETVDWPEQ